MSRIKVFNNRRKVAFDITDSRMIIDCNGCGGTSLISDRNCILCICRCLSKAGDVTSVTMRSSVDTAIQGDVVVSLRDLAFVYALMSEDRPDRKGNRCKRCKRSFSSIVHDQMESFPDVDIPILKNRVSQMEFSDPVCRLCGSDSIKLITTMEEILERLTSDKDFLPEVA